MLHTHQSNHLSQENFTRQDEFIYVWKKRLLCIIGNNLKTFTVTTEPSCVGKINPPPPLTPSKNSAFQLYRCELEIEMQNQAKL